MSVSADKTVGLGSLISAQEVFSQRVQNLLGMYQSKLNERAPPASLMNGVREKKILLGEPE